jgi:signal peptidase II
MGARGVRTRALLFAAILTVTVGCDHATKQLAQASLEPFEVVSLAADTVRLELSRNPGGFLSLGARLPQPLRHTLFVLLVPVALIAVCALLLRPRADDPLRLLAAGLIVGGGLANWLDRLLHDGAVTDFVSLGVSGLRTGIFNVADVAVLAGVAVALLPARRSRPST